MEVQSSTDRPLQAPVRESILVSGTRRIADAAASVLPAQWRLTAKLERFASPPVNGVDFGAFRRLKPISNLYGWDRGTPVDRYYIEKFLDKHRDAIQGHVLEISEDTYTKKFGGDRVAQIDILHYNDPAPPRSPSLQTSAMRRRSSRTASIA